jgi:hypothetical protein
MNRKLVAIDEVADYVPAIDPEFDDEGNILEYGIPGFWADKVTGEPVHPMIILPYIGGILWEGDIENVRSTLVECFEKGISARETLNLWHKMGWYQTHCVIR